MGMAEVVLESRNRAGYPLRIPRVCSSKPVRGE